MCLLAKTVDGNPSHLPLYPDPRTAVVDNRSCNAAPRPLGCVLVVQLPRSSQDRLTFGSPQSVSCSQCSASFPYFPRQRTFLVASASHMKTFYRFRPTSLQLESTVVPWSRLPLQHMKRRERHNSGGDETSTVALILIKYDDKKHRAVDVHVRATRKMRR